ncbi:hypothetical protein EVAR_34569_1 [Eumeta japonica]|uniref:Uncharacterized protein n=1 Tax=Eumeta variegata TaxID=151549 RepID=A0A4C1X4A3_EUMVA|nr:hypothetical protein EVAR_34569_1 [Eumeta japonica]
MNLALVNLLRIKCFSKRKAKKIRKRPWKKRGDALKIERTEFKAQAPARSRTRARLKVFNKNTNKGTRRPPRPPPPSVARRRAYTSRRVLYNAQTKTYDTTKLFVTPRRRRRTTGKSRNVFEGFMSR